MTQQAPYDETGEPFPTTYYLTCPQLVAGVARLEAAGGVERWSAALSGPGARADLERATEEQRRIRHELANGQRGRGRWLVAGFGHRWQRKLPPAQVPPRARRLRAGEPGLSARRADPRRARARLARAAAAPLSRIRPVGSHQPSSRARGGSGRTATGACSSRRPMCGRATSSTLQVDAVLTELRRRVGATFTLAELAAAYAGAERWSAVRSRSPRRRPAGRGRSRSSRRPLPHLLARRDGLRSMTHCLPSPFARERVPPPAGEAPETAAAACADRASAWSSPSWSGSPSARRSRTGLLRAACRRACVRSSRARFRPRRAR